MIEPNERIVAWDKPFDRSLLDIKRMAESHEKPRGIWYALGTEWIDWCTTEFPGRLGKYTYRLILDTSDFLFIRTLEELHSFTKKFGQYRYHAAPCVDSIDWSRIYSMYKGIEIAPYQHKARLNPDTYWYYTWDVSSGCLWHPSAVLDVIEVKTAKEDQQ